MPLRLAGLPVLTPSELAAGARSLLGWTDDAVGLLGDLPARVAALVDEAERLVERVGTTLDRIDATVGRAEEVVDRANSAARNAGSLVDEIGLTGRGAQALIDLYRPIAEQGAPLLRRFVAEFHEEEMTALVRLVDQVPVFTEHMESDILPILATLDRVGPDVHELLDVLKDVRLAIQGVPGFRMLRRRGAERDDDPTT